MTKAELDALADPSAGVRALAELHRREVLVAITAIRDELARYLFRPQNEDDLQAQVFEVLAASMICEREVKANSRDRYDILVSWRGDRGDVRIVLELKLSGSAAAVERQIQRYAATDGIDAVIVATTSARLGRRLIEGGDMIGKKPLHVIVLRTS